jgi:polysaccharide biosynthesis transport protein
MKINATQIDMDHPAAIARAGPVEKGVRPVHIARRVVRHPDTWAPSLLLEYWQMVRRHAMLLVTMSCLGLMIGLATTLLQRPAYEARTTLEIQNINENFLNMRDVRPTAADGNPETVQTDLQTQISVMQSESVLKQVITQLKLFQELSAENERSMLSVWRKQLGMSITTLDHDDVVRLVESKLKVHPLSGTRIVEILYDSYDPSVAANVANAVASVFMRQNIESRWRATQQTGDWLTRQLEDVRVTLEKSEEQMQAYATTAGLLFTDEKDNVSEAKLRQLQEELTKAQAARMAAQAQYERGASASLDSLPEVLDDPTLKDYYVKLAELRRQMAEVSSALTPLHPSVQKIQAQIGTLEAARDAERNNVIQRIRNEFESVQRRERLLAASYDSQARLVNEQASKATHYDILKREVDNERQLYDSMLQRVKEAGLASALLASNVRVIDTASPPAHPYRPNLLMNSLLAFCGVGFIALLTVVLRERSDRSIRTLGETAFFIAAPELGAIPSVAAGRSRAFLYDAELRDSRKTEQCTSGADQSLELAICRKQPPALADSFRSLFASVLYSGSMGPRIIALTSANPHEGKTTVATNLALAAAEIGRRVLLIDADLRTPRVHKIFGVPNTRGLGNLLDELSQLEGPESATIATGQGQLFILPAGSVPEKRISTLLHSSRLAELLQDLRGKFDIVLIDTPPMLHMPDARILGRLVDGVIIIVRASRTTKETLAITSDRLAEDRINIIGTVLNEWDPRNSRLLNYEAGYRAYQAQEE